MRILSYLIYVLAIVTVVETGAPSSLSAKILDAGDASSSWIGAGEIHDDPDGGRIIHGTVNGVMIVRHFQGEVRGTLHTAQLVCSIRVSIDAVDEQRMQMALCTILAHGGKDLAYAQWKCAGNSKECEGDFTFTGGSGGFSGVSGSTRFFNRMVFEKLEAGKGRAVGYASWPNLTLTLP